MFVLNCGPNLDTELKVWPQSLRANYRGRVVSLVLLATLFLTPARMPLAVLTTWAHRWLVFRHSAPRLQLGLLGAIIFIIAWFHLQDLVLRIQGHLERAGSQRDVLADQQELITVSTCPLIHCV